MATPNNGLITETNAQYYSGQQGFIGDGVTLSFVCNFNTDLANAVAGASNANYTVTVNGLAPGTFTMANNIITFNVAPANLAVILITLSTNALRSNYGGYQYTSLNDIINNFMVAYVGAGKLILSAKRTDIIFHAKRGMQEFSYDTLKSIKSQELTIPPSLSVTIPQDYVNYVGICYIDAMGLKHPIYPANNLTIAPYEVPLQDSDGNPTMDNFGDNLEGSSQTIERWGEANDNLLSGNITVEDYWAYSGWLTGNPFLGQKYGNDPQYTQRNGWFNMNERDGTISFSSNLKDRLIVLEYISDGLAYDLDMRIPKMAEDALYAHILYSILAGRINQPEYIVQRLKRDRSAKLRNAKIRLSNIKLSEIVQVMRGKSKWIKS